MREALVRKLANAVDAFDEAEEDGDEHVSYSLLMDIKDAAVELVAASNTVAVDSTSSVGLTLFEQFPVTFQGVTYKTAFNAFQAQKAPKEQRHVFCDVDTSTATALGRKCVIGVDKWDAGRVGLMTAILRTQAKQHAEFEERVLTHGARRDIVHNAMAHDFFWNQQLPHVWRALHAYFEADAAVGSAGGGDGGKRKFAEVDAEVEE